MRSCKKCGTELKDAKLYKVGEEVPRLAITEHSANYGGSFLGLFVEDQTSEIASKYYGLSEYALPDVSRLKLEKEMYWSSMQSIIKDKDNDPSMGHCLIMKYALGARRDILHYMTEVEHLDCVCKFCGYSWQELPIDSQIKEKKNNEKKNNEGRKINRLINRLKGLEE